MNSPLVLYEGVPHAVLRVADDWGIRVLDLAAPPRRLWGSPPLSPSVIRTNIDPYQTKDYLTPASLLGSFPEQADTWSAMTKRSLARLEAFFLVAEDPQRRLDAREVVTLSHQVSLVRHILDTPGRRRVLIGDEVGLGKTVVAGLIIRELVESNPSLRILYLAPARLVSNVAREFRRLSLYFREWKSVDGDARLETDNRIVASIHRAIHERHFERLLKLPPWDLIVVDECHHLSDWGVGGGDPVRKYRLVRDLTKVQPPEGGLILMSGTPHQAHSARFENLLRLLQAPGESEEAVAGRVIYRTKEDVRDWEGNPLFPERLVNAPIIVELDSAHRDWLESIHTFFQPPSHLIGQAARRAAGWKCAQALQWATSSPNAGLGYLVRQALRAGWKLSDSPLSDALAALRPYRSGPADEPVRQLYTRLITEVRRQVEDDDIEDIEEASSASDKIDHEGLRRLIKQGIDLVRATRQPKWETLASEVLEPAGAEKIVLFAQPIETVMALAGWLERRTGHRPAIIIGGQTDVERDQQVARFRDPAGPQFLVSSRAGGEGINLQFARRLVHLDVPWNPMEMEQRVGRVHRFGSLATVIVDTLVVRDSRETHAWRVARERLLSVAQTLVAPERFDAVFSRVMCLIPPEDLQSVLIGGTVGPLGDVEVQQLTRLIDAGFQEWRGFHERFAENQRQIRSQPAGLARWCHISDFLVRHGGATPVPGITLTRFSAGEQVTNHEAVAEVLELEDGSLRFAGDFNSGFLNGEDVRKVEPLGLNIPSVANLLRRLAIPSMPTGAAYLRLATESASLSNSMGRKFIILAFVRQAFRLDSVGGFDEAGLELLMYGVNRQRTVQLDTQEIASVMELIRSSTVRTRPTQCDLYAKAVCEEQRLMTELRTPSESAIRVGMRYAIWPIVALHFSP